MEQREVVENSGPWTEEDPHWFISVWGDDSSVQAKLQQQRVSPSATLIWHHT